MNHVYRLKRSGRAQQLQPVPENARSASKGSASTGKTMAQIVGGTLASFALSGLAGLAYAQQAPPAVNQLPQGGVVTRGSANINTSTTPAGNALMTVNQASNRAVIDWASFNVGSQAKVQFNQPSSSAVVLNNILGNNASQIYGQISANGQVFLSNPNGVYFSPTAQVNVGGLVATTGKANADEFMAGKASFNRSASTGSIVNEGQLNAALGGYIALLAPEVRNQGVIVAQAGTVALASGEAITLNFNTGGTGLAGITTTPQAIAALVENRSAVLAEGGQIILSAHALASLQGAVVKNSGQLSATSLSSQGGKIVLMGESIELTGTSQIQASGATGGGTVLVGGDWQGSGDTRQATKVSMAQGASIAANATQNGDGGKVVLWSDVKNANSLTQVEGRIEAKAAGTGNGGQVETSGHTLKVGDTTLVYTLSPQGQTGHWLIDPKDYTVAASGGDMTGSTLTTNLLGGSVTIASTSGATDSTTAGSIFINDTVNWSANTLTLNAQNNVTISKALTLTGTAGLSVLYGQGAVAASNTGLFAVTAPINIASTGSFSTQLGNNGTLTSYSIVNALGAAADATTAPASPSLQGMARTAVAGNAFVLGSDIDASGTSTWNSASGFTPIGNGTTAFTGKFNGLGHTITGLTVSAATTDYLGLFGKTTGSISNVTLSGSSISGRSYVGAVAGYGADFYNIRILGGSVTGSAYVGGMAGYASSTANTVNTSAAVNGVDAATTPARFIGGMLGAATSAVNNATSTGNVTVTNATASLASGSNALTSTSLGTLHSVGGLIGQLAPSADMTLANNISTGNVTVTTTASTCVVNYCISNVGGLIGTMGGSANSTASNWRVTLTDSSTSGNVSVSSTTAASMSSHLTNIANNTGGMIGRIGNIGSGMIFSGDLTLTNLSTSGNVSGYSGVGGLVGYSHVAGGTAGANVFSNLSATGNITGYGAAALVAMPSLNPSFASTGLGGLFAASEGAKAGQIQNSFYSGDIVSNGGGYIGGLVGAARGQITNSYATGTISLPSTSFSGIYGVVSIGGLVGYLGGNGVASGVSGGSYSNVSITLGATTPLYAGAVGGAVGHMAPGTGGAIVAVNDIYALGNIQITSAAQVTGGSGYNTIYIGGLVGNAPLSTALTGTASVQGTTLTVSGNLLVSSTISNYLGVGSLVVGPGILPGSYVTALGTGTGGAGTYTLNQVQTTGGATISGIGLKAYTSYINNSYAAGNIMALIGSNIGGLAGNAGAVFNSHASGNVTGYYVVGGLTGASGAIYSSYALGNATLSGTNGGKLSVGGLSGTNTFGVSSSYWAGQSVSGGNVYTGGLVGSAGGPILNSYVTGSGQVSDGHYVGGLVGSTSYDITGSYSTASVNATSDYDVGGLVGKFGYTDKLPTLASSWSSGAVTGGYGVGGLVGTSYGTVINSYATGAVTSTSSASGAGVGGLIGTNLAGGSVSNSFATGAVVSALATLSSGTTGSNVKTTFAGGLIGFNQSSGSINNSYASGSVTINNNGSAGGLIGYTAIPEVSTISPSMSITVTSTAMNISPTSNLVAGVIGVGATVTGVGGATGVTIVSGTGYGSTGSYTLNQTTTGTSWSISNPTSSSAASISGNTLTLGGTVKGYFAPGTVITGTGVPANTYITGIQSTTSTLANGFGGAGSQYTLSISASSPISGAVTGTNTALSVAATVPVAGFLVFNNTWSVGGGFAVGMTVTGPGINPGTTITGFTSKTVSGNTTYGYTLSDSSFGTITTPIAVTGQLASPNISNVYATGNVKTNTTYSPTYYSYLGGLIGQVASTVPASISAAYSAGEVTAPVTAKINTAVTNGSVIALSSTNMTGGGVKVGATVSGAGIPAGTTVTAISGSNFTLSRSVTVTANQVISVTSSASGTAVMGGVIGYVGTGNTTGISAAGSAVAPTFSAMYFNSSANSGYYAIGNDAIGAAATLGADVTGLNSSDLRTTSALSGLTFTTTTLGSAASGRASAGNYWVLVDADGTYNNNSGATGATYPMLASEYALKVTSGHQMQLMGLNTAATYSLQNSINFSGSDVWSGAGFVPVGTPAQPFTGTFIGSALSSGSQAACPAASGGCTISNLTINSTQPAPVGLFGTVDAAATLSGIRLLQANVTGIQSVGAVVGSNAGTLSFSSSTGTVTSSNSSGTGYGVGGVAGVNTGAVDRVFSTATVTGTAGANMLVGGVIGDNQTGGTLSNAYASSLVAISSGGYAGGLAGANSGAISNSYAAGPVAGLATVSGGLVGNNASGTISNSFWDTTVTGQSAAVASNPAAGTSNHNAGLSTADMKTLANYNSATTANGNHDPNWDLITIWNPPVTGMLYPALRDFLIPITVTANAVTKVYDALAYSGTVSVRYSLPNVSLSGTVGYESSISGYTHVGSYTVTPTGLYSNQYNVSFASGPLTITKRPLTFTASSIPKVYDGTSAMDPANISINNLVSGQTLTITSVNAVSSQVSANASNYINSISLGNATDGSGGLIANYSAPTTLSRTNAPVTITPVTLSSVTASNKVYDGTTTATFAGGSLTGVLAADSALVTLSGSFASKNVADGITVTPVLSGLSGSNYTVAPGTLTANITRLNSVTWVGGSTGNWFDPTNWAPSTNLSATGAVPDLSNVANVVIPTGKTVSFNSTVTAPAQAGTVNIDSLAGSGGTAGSLTLSAGTLNVGTGGVSLATLSQTGGTLSFTGNSSLTTTGAMTLGAVTATGSLNVTSSGGDITLGGNITMGSSPLVIKATGNIVQNVSTMVSSTGGNISYWSDSDASGAGSIALNDGTSTSARAQINAGAGNIILGGGNGASAADGQAIGVKGIQLGNFASLSGGDITLVGKGGAAAEGVGVSIGSSATVSATGSVSITGTGGSASGTSNNRGVDMGASTIESTGTGSVTITGTGGGAGSGAANYGVFMTGSGNSQLAKVSTVSGALTLVATSGYGVPSASVGFVPMYYVQIGSSTQTGSLTVRASNMLTSYSSTSTSFQTTGAVKFEPAVGNTSFTSAVGVPYIVAGASSVTIGRSGSTAVVEIGQPLSVQGPVNIYGDTALYASLTATGQISIAGALGTTGSAIKLTAPSLLVSGSGASNVVMSTDIGTFAGSGMGTVYLVNQGALTIGSVGGTNGASSSGYMNIATLTGDLTVAENLATTSNWGVGAAIVLNAGQNKSALDRTGGNVVLSAGKTITVGAGGNAIAYTGSVAGSTGLATLVGSGTGHFRYGSDETTQNYTSYLGTGLYAIYREQPTVSWSSGSDQSIVYGQSPTISNLTGNLSTYSTTGSYSTGLQNGDEAKVSQALVMRTATAPKTAAVLNASNVYDVGVYEISKTASAEALGYAGVNPLITVTKAPLAITVKSATKTYDAGRFYGGAGLTYSGFVGTETASALGGAIVYGGAAQGAANAGTYALTASGLTAKNYSLNYTAGSLTINPKALTIRVNDDARFVGQTDTVGYAGVSYTGFVPGQSITNLGTLSISRTSNSTAPGTYSGVLQASISNSTNNNYTITYVPGSYTIVPADQLLVKFANIATTYGTEPVYSLTSAQYLKSSTNTVIDLTSRASLTGTNFSLTDGDGGSTTFTMGPQATSLSSAGKINAYGGYQLAASSISNSSTNYKNTITTTGALTVNPLGISVAASSGLTKTYDGTTDMNGLGLTLTGVLGVDKVAATGQGVYSSANAATTNYAVNNLVLSGVDMGNYVLSAGNSISGTNGSITQASLTVTANSDLKLYDGIEYLGGKGVIYSGFVNNEGVGVLGGTLTYAGDSQHAINAGSYTITPQGLTSTNYNFTYVNAPLTVAPLTITTRPIAGELQGPIAKVYDGSDSATLSSANYILTGWVSTDSATVNKTTGTYDNANVGSAKMVSVSLQNSDYVAGGTTNLSNYVLPTTIVGAAGAITPKPVTVTGLAAANKTYDGNSSVVITQWGSVATGVINESLTLLSGTASFVDASAQNGKTVTASGYSLANGAGGAASNYTLTSSTSTTTANIDQKAVTVSSVARTTTYDGTTTYADLTSTTGFVSSALAQGDWVASVTKAAGGTGVTSSGVAQAGSYTVTPSVATLGAGSASNYSFSYAASTNTVDKANLALTATASLTGNVYRGSAYTGTYTSNALGSDASGMSVTGVATGTDAGTYTSNLAVTGAALANYNTPVVSNADLVISPKAVTVTNTSRSTTYDGVSSYSTLANSTAFTAALVGLDRVGSVTQTANGVTASGLAQAGSFTVTPSAAVLSTGTASNYSFSYVDSTHTVDKANLALTATASLTGNVYRGSAYTGTYTTNALGSDASGMSVTGLATGTDAGTYTSNLAVTGAALSNYNTSISITNANLVVSPKAVTVTNTSRSTTYDGVSSYSTLANGTQFTSSALVGLDRVGSVTQTANGVTPSGVAQAGNFTVTPSLAVLSSGTASNYSFSYVDSTHTVDMASLGVTISGALQGAVSKPYDGNNTATLASSNYRLTGWLGSDGATVTKTSGTYDSANAGSGKTVTVTLNNSDYAAHSGTNLTNYSLPSSISGAVGDISKVNATVTANSGTLTYNGANQTVSGFTASGLVGVETTSVLTGVNASTTQKNAGTYVTTASGTDGNYNLTFVDGSMVINKAALTATGNSASVTYNGANQSVGGFTVSGLQGTDTVSGLNSISATGATAKNAGSYANTVTAGTETNYTVSTVNGSLDITKASATVTANGANLTYNGANQTTSGFTASGLVGGETAVVLTGVSATRTEKNAGTYATTASGTDGNYNLTFVDGAMVINKAALTVRANNDARFVTQSDATGFAGVSYSGWVGGESPTVLGGSAVVTRSASGPDGNTGASNVSEGSYTGVLTATGLTSNNYTISYAPGNYTVVPVDQLLVKVTPAASTYGTAASYSVAEAKYLNRSHVISDLTGNVTRSGNTFTVSDGAGGSATFTISPVNAVTSGAGQLAAGSYALAATGANVVSNNFSNNLTLVGSQSVMAVPVTAVPSISKVYDGTTTISSQAVPVTGALPGDTVGGSGAGAFASKIVGNNLSYSITGLNLAGPDARNYYLSGSSAVSGNNGSITPAPLTVNFTAANKVYDGNTTASLSSTDNRLGNDVLTVSATGVFADKNVGTGKSVTVSNLSLSGQDANNYTLSGAGNNPTANITRLAQVAWVGGTTGNWFDPANWAGGAVPDLANVANVTIPAGVTVSFGTTVIAPAQAGTVTLDSLGTAGSLNQSGGTLNVGSGGVTLANLTQTGGSLSSTGAVAVGSLSQTAGSLSAGSLSTTSAYNQSGTGTVTVTGPAQISAITSGVVLGQLTVGGALNVNGTGGHITQTGPITVAGTTQLNAGIWDVNLPDQNNSFTGTVTATAAHTVVAGHGGIAAAPVVAPTLPASPDVPVVAEPKLLASQVPYRVTVAKLPSAGELGLVNIELKDALADQQIALPQAVQDWLVASAPVIASGDLDSNVSSSVNLIPGGMLRLTRVADGQPSPVILKSAAGALILRIVKAP